jgi:hypothetical protein
MFSINTPATPSIFQRIILRPLGLSSENSFVFWLLLLICLLFGGTLWVSGGNVFAAAGIIVVAGIFALSVFKPVYCFYLFMLLVLVFDQYGVPGFSPLTHHVQFFQNLKQISYIPSFSWADCDPEEIFMLFLVIGLAVQRAVRKDFRLRAVPIWGATLFFFCALVFTFLYGMHRGGDFLVSLWQMRALFYLLIMFLLTPQLIRSRDELKGLIWIFIIGISVKAFQGIYRFISLGFTTGGIRTLTNHEDPVFMTTLFILLLGFLIYGAMNKQRRALIILALPLLLGFYVGQRRAAYAGLMVSVCVFIVLLSAEKRRIFLKYAIPCFIVIALYAAVFWNSQGTLGRPARIIKSGFVTQKGNETLKDYQSNLYRKDENYDLAQTVKKNPAIGIGFGKAFYEPIFLPRIAFPLQDYISHNEILWIMVTMGGIGFFAFWLFFHCFATRGTRLLRRLNDPYLKAITAVIILAVINQMVVSYYDLQLTFYRSMIYLGCLAGLLKTIEMLHEDTVSSSLEVTDENSEYATV